RRARLRRGRGTTRLYPGNGTEARVARAPGTAGRVGGTGMSETVVADVRSALVTAVAAHVERPRRRPVAPSIGAAAVALGVVATGTASGTGWLFGAPAPSRVATEMHRFERQTPPPHVHVAKTLGVPFGRPTAVAHAAGYTLYLLRTGAHECF